VWMQQVRRALVGFHCHKDNNTNSRVYVVVSTFDPIFDVEPQIDYPSGVDTTYAVFRLPNAVGFDRLSVTNLSVGSMAEIYPRDDAVSLEIAIDRMLLDMAKMDRVHELAMRMAQGSNDSPNGAPLEPAECTEVSFVALDRENVTYVHDRRTCGTPFSLHFDGTVRNDFRSFRPERLPFPRGAEPLFGEASPSLLKKHVLTGLLAYSKAFASPLQADEDDMQVMVRCVHKTKGFAVDVKIVHACMEHPTEDISLEDWTLSSGLFVTGSEWENDRTHCTTGVFDMDPLLSTLISKHTKRLAEHGAPPEVLSLNLALFEEPWTLKDLLTAVSVDWEIVSVWLTREVVVWCKNRSVYLCLVTHDKMAERPHGRRLLRMEKIRAAHSIPSSPLNTVHKQGGLLWADVAGLLATWLHLSRPLLKDPHGDPRRIVITTHSRTPEAEDHHIAWLLACRRDVEVWQEEVGSWKSCMMGRAEDSQADGAGDDLRDPSTWNTYIPASMDNSDDFILLRVDLNPSVDIFSAKVIDVDATGSLTFCVTSIAAGLRELDLEVATVHFTANQVLYDHEGLYAKQLVPNKVPTGLGKHKEF